MSMTSSDPSGTTSIRSYTTPYSGPAVVGAGRIWNRSPNIATLSTVPLPFRLEVVPLIVTVLRPTRPPPKP